MDLYRHFARPLLFKLDAERAHHVTLAGLRAAHACGLTTPFTPKSAFSRPPIEVMGLSFPNRIGLGAGLDKAGNTIAALGSLGFGFIEVGTITPRPQPGNPKPRLFRLREHEAIINRMGFNNPGMDAALENIDTSRQGYPGIVGINIGKNADTPIENALDDYLLCLQKAYSHADYIAVNFSSPNTKNLRELQNADAARALLGRLKEEQALRAQRDGRYVPLAVKIAPDLENEQIAALGALFSELKMDAVIATNTTTARDAVKGHPLAHEAGGLSGAPVTEVSTRVIRSLRKTLDPGIPIIGVGGILNRADAEEKLAAGAALVQIYTGLIYRGSRLVRELLRACPTQAPLTNNK